MTSQPAPPVPPDADLRNFHWVHWPYKEWFNSLWWGGASDRARVVVLELLAVSFQQVPAGSLPNNPRWIADKASYGRDPDAWRTLADEVMSAFVLCSDNRFYNPIFGKHLADAWRAKSKKKTALAGDAQRKREARAAKRAKAAVEKLRQLDMLGAAAAAAVAEDEKNVQRTSGGRPAEIRPIETKRKKNSSPVVPTRRPARIRRSARALEGRGAKAPASRWFDAACEKLASGGTPMLMRQRFEQCRPAEGEGCCLVAATATDARALRTYAADIQQIVGHAITFSAPGDAVARG